MKRYFRLSLILLCLLMVLPLYAMAANEQLGVSTSGTVNSSDTDVSDGTLSMTVKGSNVNGTLTLTNSGTEAAILSFSYEATGDISSFTVAGGSVSNTGSYNAELAGGSSVAIYLSVPTKALFGSNKSATVKLTSVKLEVPQAANVTIIHNTLGSVSAGDTAVASGGTIEVPAAGTTLTASPNPGAAFVGWVNTADNSLVSESASFVYKPTGDISLKAVFASPTTAAPFWGSNKAYLFEDLSAAIAHATNASNKVITLAGNGILSSGDYTIPSGVTLVIPFDSAGTWYAETPGCDESNWTQPTAFYTLTMKSGANIIVNGAISVSAKITAKMGYSGNPTSKYGHVAMNAGSTITVNNGANLYAWGYITGSGNVTIRNGGTVHEAFQVMDWRGGTYTTKMLDNGNKVFPMSQYYVQNVEAPMTLESGAKEKCCLSAVISKVLQQKIVPFFGQSGHMFNITSGSVTKRYDGSVDRLVFDINGDFNVGSISIVMSEGILGFIGRVEIKSANYVLPVNHNITLNINGGSTVTLNQTASFMPGVQVNIAERATLKVSSGKQLFVYDASEWVEKNFIYYPTGLTDFAPVPYAPSRSYTRTKAADIVDTQIKVNGTLDAAEGKLYTTAGGSNIFSTGSGLVKLSATDTSQKLYETTQTSDSPAYSEIPITAPQLKNGNGEYVATADTGAGDYVYDATHDKWALTAHTVTDVVTPPTCQETGYTTHTCSCGYKKQDSETPVIPCADVDPLDGICDMCGTVLCEHSERIAVGEAKNPTCTEKGITAGEKCSACGTIIVAQEEISALGHTPGEAATCTTAQTCTVCGVEIVAALDHDFSGAWQKDDTNHWKKCSRCDATDQTGTHSYGEPQFTWSGYECTAKVVCSCSAEQGVEVSVSSAETTEATCTVKGVKTYTATAVWNEQTYTSAEHPTEDLGLDSNNHKNTKEEAQVDATCTEVGYTAGVYCNDCEKWISGHVEIPQAAHNYGDPTYTGDGKTSYVATRECTCGDTQTATAEITSKVTKAATCTAEGETTYTADFAEEWAEDKVTTEPIDKLAHSYGEPQFTWSGYECTAKVVCSCSAEQGVEVSVSSAETTEATCTVKGVKTYTATAVWNEQTYTSAEHPTEDLGLDSNNHKNTKEEAQVDATCTEVGYTAGVYCNDCEKWISGHVEIPQAAHSHGDKWKYDETNHWHECVCGDKADLAEHGWDAGVVTTQPTTSATGVMTYTCDTCETTRTETIDKLTGTTVAVDVLTNNLETGPQITLLSGTTAGEGWNKEGNVIAGSTVDFSVTFDKACVVIVETTDTDGNLVYTKVPAVATADKNTYNFSTNVVEGMRIIVAVKGDVNSDGRISMADVSDAKNIYLKKFKDATELERLIADITGDSRVSMADVSDIKNIFLKKNTTTSW